VPDETSEYLRRQATKCRLLASTTLDQQVGATLRGMADDYDRQAEELRNDKDDGPRDQVGD
jgi:hypothetical protein